MSFVEVKSVKKSFGQGDSRVEVLKGIDLEIATRKHLFNQL